MLVRYLFIFAFLLLDCVKSNATEGRVYVLGYPRAGNHWSVYCISQISGLPCISHPTFGPFLWMSSDPNNTVNLADPFNQRCFFHGHNPIDAGLHLANKETDFIILVLRDYKESFMSVNGEDESTMGYWLNGDLSIKNSSSSYLRINSYINNIKCFDEWADDRKFIIYYEDLVTDPEIVLSKLGHFLNCDQQKVEDYLKNFEMHWNTCMSGSFITSRLTYEEYRNNMKKHVSKMSKHSIKQMDRFYRKYFFEYWIKYLGRYDSEGANFIKYIQTLENFKKLEQKKSLRKD